MGSKTDAFETDLLEYLFNSTAIPGLTTTLAISLGTGTPSDSSYTETTYSNYVRVTKARSNTTVFSVTGNSVTNDGTAGEIAFATCGATGATITSFGIHSIATAGVQWYWGEVSPNLVVATSDTPTFAAGTLTITED